jgi:uncharacterized protein DUF4136
LCRATAAAFIAAEMQGVEKKMRIATFLSTVSLMMLGAVALAQTVTYDFDKGASFGRYKTYAWVRGTNVNDELSHKRIVRAIDAQLATKGFARVERTENPDVLVAYHASFENELQINATGYGGIRWNRSGTARVEEIPVGTLAVDMVDANTNTIVWRGMASREIDVKASPEKREKNINKAAEKLLKNYPPK